MKSLVYFLPRTIVSIKIMAAISVVFATGCSVEQGGKGTGSAEGPKVTLTGVAQAGPIKGEVSVYKLLSSGERGAKIGVTSSDEFGRFSLQVPLTEEAVVIAATGVYTDEATGQVVDMKGQELTQILPSVSQDQSTPVTPLSTMVHDAVIEDVKQNKVNASSVQLSVKEKSSEVAKLFGIPEQILKELPDRPSNASTTTPAGQAATVLIVLSHAMKESGLTPDKNVNPAEAIRSISKEFATKGRIGSASDNNAENTDSGTLTSSWAQKIAISKEKVLVDLKAEVPKEWIAPTSGDNAENVAPVSIAQTIKVVGYSPAYPVRARDQNGDALKFAVVEQAKRGTIKFLDQFSGLFVYTPDPSSINDPTSHSSQPGMLPTDTFSYKVSDGKLDSVASIVTLEFVPESGVLGGKCYKNGIAIADLPDNTGFCAATGQFYVDGSAKIGLNQSGTGSSDGFHYTQGKLTDGVVSNSCYRSGAVVAGLDSEGTGYCLGNNTFYIRGNIATNLDDYGNGAAEGVVYRGGSKFSGVDEGKCYVNGIVNSQLDSQGSGTCNNLLYAAGRAVTGLVGNDCYSGGEKANTLANGTGWCHGLISSIRPSNLITDNLHFQKVVVDKDDNLIVAQSTCVQKILRGVAAKTIAGKCGEQGFVNATGVNARFTQIRAIAVDNDGAVYVTDWGPVIRKISPEGLVSTVLEKPTARYGGYNDKGGDAYRGIAVDADKNIFFSDTSIFKVTGTNQATLVTRYNMREVEELEVTKDGNLFVYDSWLMTSYLVLEPQTLYRDTPSLSSRILTTGYFPDFSKTINLPDNLYKSKHWSMDGFNLFYFESGVGARVQILGLLDNLWQEMSSAQKKGLSDAGKLLGIERMDFGMARNSHSQVLSSNGDWYFLENGRLFKMPVGKYFKNGEARNGFNYNGTGVFEGKRYENGAIYSGYFYDDKRCYVNGEANPDFNSQGSYCAGGQVFVIGGEPMPGLDSVGTGFTSDGTRYVNGVSASGVIDNKLYANGRLFVGISDGKYYKDGVLLTGLAADGKYYSSGLIFTGLLSSKYYKDGLVGSGLYDGIFYKDGDPFSGLDSGKYYQAGVLGSGTHNGKLYVTGLPASGTIDGKFYADGLVFTGLLGGVLYDAGIRIGAFYVNNTEGGTSAYCNPWGSSCYADIEFGFFPGVCTSAYICEITIGGRSADWYALQGPDPMNLLFSGQTGQSNDRTVTISAQWQTNKSYTFSLLVRFRPTP